MTMKLSIEYLSPFARIAQIYCPNVYEHLIEPNELELKQTNSTKYIFTYVNISVFCLCVLLLLLTGIFLLHLTSIRVIILSLQHKFLLPD